MGSADCLQVREPSHHLSCCAQQMEVPSGVCGWPGGGPHLRQRCLCAHLQRGGAAPAPGHDLLGAFSGGGPAAGRGVRGLPAQKQHGV